MSCNDHRSLLSTIALATLSVSAWSGERGAVAVPRACAAAATSAHRPAGAPADCEACSVTDGVPHHPSQLLVRFKEGTTRAERQSVHNTASAKRVLREYRIVSNLQLVEVPKEELPAALNAYRAHPRVLYAEPDYIVYPSEVPDDPDFDLLWGLHNTGQTVNGDDPGTPGADIRALGAWDFWTGDPEFAIAVIDTGVDYNHPDLQGNIWQNPDEVPGNGIDDDGNGYIDDIVGYDFKHEDNDPMDIWFHGTHVAGTIGAVANNLEGVAGVNWRCRIAILKFMDGNWYGGGGEISDAIRAMEYAVIENIRVSNNSWGGGGDSQGLRDAIEAAQAIGHIFVIAAGNYHKNTDYSAFYPAAYRLPNMIAVAATDNDDNLAWFSDWGGATVDLGAPGVNIYSLWTGTDYGYSDGTSMATPHVAGVVGLIMSRRPDWTFEEVRARIMNTVRPVDALIGRTVTGGVVNAANVGDCNGNGVADETDIDAGTSVDCTANGVPDECEPDCNGNTVADSCDIHAGTSLDCNGNVIPDECEPDCNSNGVADACDVLTGTSEDCAHDIIPDECEPDCNGNGEADSCDILAAISGDCNDNFIPDECDIADGTSLDDNANRVPDECDVIVYVDAQAPPGGNGISWATAFDNLTDVTVSSCGCDLSEVWVAKGTYKPTMPGGNRSLSFNLLGMVRIYGGFAGGESRWDERDPVSNITTLSGDLNGDDGPEWTNREDNSFHVVNGYYISELAMLDGFVITGGHANGDSPHNQGGGVYLDSGALTFSNCTFVANWAEEGAGAYFYSRYQSTKSARLNDCTFTGNSAVRGGGVYTYSSDPIFVACMFTGNSAEDGGGVYNNPYSDPTFIDCTLANNSASDDGGGVYGTSSDATFTGCTFSQNSAEGHGGGLCHISGGWTLANCVFSGNVGYDGGGVCAFAGSDSLWTGCTFSGNSAANRGGGMYTFASSPTLIECALRDNWAAMYGGGIYLGENTTLLGCTLAGNSCDHWGGGAYVGSGLATLANCTFSGNAADYGAGAYVTQSSDPVFTNCTFSENAAGPSGGGGLYATGTGTNASAVALRNCILWGNRESDVTSELAQIRNHAAVLSVDYSCVQGWTGGLGGVGNIGADPVFADSDGSDDIVGTQDDDLQLRSDSPCIDAGDSTAVPAGITTDADGGPRLVDDPATPDTGNALSGEAVVDMGAYEFADCNANGTPDRYEIPVDCGGLCAVGCAPDCNCNGIMDSCEPPDCNENDVPDECEIPSVCGGICMENCDSDCNCNGTPDYCDLPDCDENDIPDECQIPVGCGGLCIEDCDSDCNCNGNPDSCDEPDCNANRQPDQCDIDNGTSLDGDGNGIPDECECPVAADPPLSNPDGLAKNRYISLVPTNAGARTALRITLTNPPPGFEALTGAQMWADTPQDISEESGSAGPNPPVFKGARLTCEPFYTDWGAVGLLHVYGEAIIPGTAYEVQAIAEACPVAGEPNYSAALVITTSTWGDCVGECAMVPCSAPDGDCNFDDISAVVDKFKNLPGAPSKCRADLAPGVPDRIVDFTDIPSVVDAFRGRPYPYAGPPVNDPCQ